MVSGAFVGAIPSLFFQEIVNARVTALMSLTLSLLLGTLLVFLSTFIINKVFSSNDKPRLFVLFGFAVSIFAIYLNGIIVVSPSETFHFSYPLIYSGIIGSDIGSIVFSIMSTLKVIREIFNDRKEKKNNAEKLEEIKKTLGMN